MNIKETGVNIKETAILGTSVGSSYIYPVNTSAGIAKVIPDGLSVPTLHQKKPLVRTTCLNNLF